MEANNIIYLRNPLEQQPLKEVSTINVSAKRNENPTIFGESDSQTPEKVYASIPQPAILREISRVEQWINEWKLGIMKIEAGSY